VSAAGLAVALLAVGMAALIGTSVGVLVQARGVPARTLGILVSVLTFTGIIVLAVIIDGPAS
jgi:hypothetical protein